MSDPVSNSDIEDVLSSIRRLVSEEPAKRRNGKEEAPVNYDRLVLTPAFRVADDAQSPNKTDVAANSGEHPESPLVDDLKSESPVEQELSLDVQDGLEPAKMAENVEQALDPIRELYPEETKGRKPQSDLTSSSALDQTEPARHDASENAAGEKNDGAAEPLVGSIEPSANQISDAYEAEGDWQEPLSDASPETLEASSEASSPVETVSETPASDPRPDVENSAAEISTSQADTLAPAADMSLEKRIAELEAAIQQAPQEWEPDGSEEGNDDETRPLSADLAEKVNQAKTPEFADVDITPQDDEQGEDLSDILAEPADTASGHTVELEDQNQPTQQTDDAALSEKQDPPTELVETDASHTEFRSSLSAPSAAADTFGSKAEDITDSTKESEDGTDTSGESQLEEIEVPTEVDSLIEALAEVAATDGDAQAAETGPVGLQKGQSEPAASDESTGSTNAEATDSGESGSEEVVDLEVAKAAKSTATNDESSPEAANPVSASDDKADGMVASLETPESTAVTEERPETSKTLSDAAVDGVEASEDQIDDSDAKLEAADKTEDDSDISVASADVKNDVESTGATIEGAEKADHLSLSESDGAAADARETEAEIMLEASSAVDSGARQSRTTSDEKTSSQDTLQEWHKEGESVLIDEVTDTDDDPLENLLSDDDSLAIDEEVLRQMVAELVRQELSGVLGERITRNVRRLVRREIQRALAIRDLE